MPSSRGFSKPRDGTCVSYVSCIGRWVLYHWHHLGSHLPTWESSKKTKNKTLTIPSIEDTEQLELSHIADGDPK